MRNKARIRAYKAVEADPYVFLKRHYGLTPESDIESIRAQFTTFARATGVGQQSIEAAITAYRARNDVAPFVLQAASAECVDAYEDA